MKKNLILAAAVAMFAASGAVAQVSIVKEAERAIGKMKPAEVVAMIQPAFSDSETSGSAQTYYVPGKAFFSEFDKLFGLKQFGQLQEGGDITMADDVVAGYDYYVKALPLDTVVDAKGKVKTKYSKEIVNTITGHAPDYNNAAIAYWGDKNYDGAYRAWEIFTSIYEDMPFAANIKAQPDSVIGEIYYNQALAAWQADKLENALKAFGNARNKGYNKKQLYDYAIAVAQGLNDQAAMSDWAQKGHELYGAEDAAYLGYIINGYLQAKEFDKAFAAIDQAIATDPNNSQFYFVKGVLYDNQDKKPEAKSMFKKAVDLDGENVNALTQYGASLCQEAYAISDAAPTNLTVAESEKYFNEKIKPLFEEAAIYLEKAWSLDNDNRDALRYLDNIYYNLHDDVKMKDVQDRMNY